VDLSGPGHRPGGGRHLPAQAVERLREGPLGRASLALYSACFWVLAPALKTIPVGIAYAIWAGVGIAAAGAIGAFAFGERLGPLQLTFVAMIMVGAVGLRLTTSAE